MITLKDIKSMGILVVVVCVLTLSGCGTAAGDRVDDRNAGATESAGNQGNPIAAASPSAAANKVNAPDKAVEQGTTQTPNNITPASTGPKPQIGTGGSDLFQFTQARAAIDSDPELKNAKLEIDIKASVLTLSGSVTSAEQKAKAEQLVRAVKGIKDVNNRLKISK